MKPGGEAKHVLQTQLNTGEEEINTMKSNGTESENNDGSPSLRLVFDLASNSAQALADQASQIDSKLLGFLGIGSVVVGLAATAGSLSLAWPICGREFLFIFGGGSYVILLVASMLGLWPRSWAGIRSPSRLREFADMGQAEAMDALLDYTAEDYKSNQNRLGEKSRMLRVAAITFAVEMVCVTCWAIVEAASR